MKSYIKSALLALGAVAMLSACDENSWNDKLDGFEVPEIGSTSSAINYTLTKADYEKIASNNPYKAYATANEQSDILAQIKTGAFPSEDIAATYLSMFLRDSTNTFYAMANGSAVKVTYNVAENVPAIVTDINANTARYTLTEEDYILAWGSDQDYIDAFSPSTPAARNIPALLKSAMADAEAGQYAVVTYNEAQSDPIFQQVGGEEEPEFECTSALTGIAVGDAVSVKGYVTAICTRGFILTDNSGSILCYQAKNFSTDDVAIGNFVSVEQTVSAYNKGLQLAIADNTSYDIEGTGSYTYPAPKAYTAEMIDEAVTRTTDALAEYVTFTGKIALSGNYINVIIEGSENQGSVYYAPDDVKAKLVDGETMQLTGYFMAISGKGPKYFNIILTDAKAASAKAPASRGAVVDVPSTVKNAMYQFDGSAWKAVTNVTVLQPADYTAMGQKYGNLSNNLPDELLPAYCKATFPYAAVDDVVTIAYLYYGGGTTKYEARQLVYDGSEWSMDAYQTPVTSQFVKNKGFWNFDPSVVLTLPYARNTEPSYSYYMACVNWVFENIGKPMGGTSLTSSPFIDYRGNAEFYSGASAFYGNVDVRAVTALNNAPEGYTGYEGLTNEEVGFLVKKRFCLETMPGALSMLHPDAKQVAGIDEVTYTINFTAYEEGGVAAEQTVVYVVTGPGQFSYKSCTWFTAGEDADWTAQ